MKRGGFREGIGFLAPTACVRGHLPWELKDVSDTPRPEGWARVRAGEGAGRAYLSSPIDGPPTFSDAKRGPARDGRGDEYGQRGGCGAVPAVPAAPREDRHEPDADGAKSAVIADKEPCKAFNARALQAAKGKIALSPTYLKYLKLLETRGCTHVTHVRTKHDES